jgi:diguanylate cyclase (GGDEF)-like protein
LPGAPSDLLGADARRPARVRAPGQIGLGIVALAVGLAVIVAVSGDGQAYWLCVPAGLLAASWCPTVATVALATAATMAGAGAPTFVWAADRPAAWAAVLVPIAAAAIAQTGRSRSERDRDDLRDFALTDPLTRVANRRALLAQADHEIARHRRAQQPLAFVMLDLDGFKAVNDRFGHGAGDDLLRDVARALQRTMRGQDTVARLGGDEFCVLAPETDPAGAQQLAGRVAAAVRSVTVATRSVHASVGAATYPEDGEAPAQLIEIADARLLAAKRELYRGRPDRPARRAA